MLFKDAVDAVESVRGQGKGGLSAMTRADSGRIKTRAPRKIRGSLALDEVLAARYPTAARWDFGVGWEISASDDRAIWIEVHSADSLHVSPVLEKLKWLQGWLATEGKPLAQLEPRFIWISTGRIAFSARSPQAIKVREAGVILCGQSLSLDKLP